MALIFLAGAGYAWYTSTQDGSSQQTPKYPLDPDLNLDDKESIDFWPLELRSSLLSNAHTTITFYNGDYRKIVNTVEQRVKEILAVNPWLGGWYVPKKLRRNVQSPPLCDSDLINRLRLFLLPPPAIGLPRNRVKRLLNYGTIQVGWTLHRIFLQSSSRGEYH
jgi:hypothetical protein